MRRYILFFNKKRLIQVVNSVSMFFYLFSFSLRSTYTDEISMRRNEFFYSNASDTATFTEYAFRLLSGHLRFRITRHWES